MAKKPPELIQQPSAPSYRLRWSNELVFKQLKFGLGMKTILAWRPGAVAALVAAKSTSPSGVGVLLDGLQHRLQPLLELLLEGLAVDDEGAHRIQDGLQAAERRQQFIIMDVFGAQLFEHRLAGQSLMLE